MHTLPRSLSVSSSPARIYSLTELGQTLKPVLDAMWAWGESYKKRIEEREG